MRCIRLVTRTPPGAAGLHLDGLGKRCHIAGNPAGSDYGHVMTTLVTWVTTLLHGRRVGKDSFGNIYYEERKTPKQRRKRRWVVYNGVDEASRVPPLWHAWLHYTIDAPPDESAERGPAWQKAHVPNVTGTAQAYRPPGHTLQGGRRAKATGDYDPWIPG